MSETRSPELALALKRPFAEQVAFFRGKLGNLVPTAKWDELWKAQHDRAFMVAGAAKADLLADLAGAVDKAIAEGETLEQFRKRFRQIVTDRGWHGWTGEGTKAGEAWRTRVIYETNLITSYSAGRLEQLRAGGYRYWMYKHSDSRNPRPHHRALDGVVLPADDPFWQSHYPPNGWGCRCRAVGVDGPRSAQRLGGDFNKPLPRGWNTIDPKTGEPVGIDKGWGYMPGATVADAISQFAGKIPRLPAEVGAYLGKDLPLDKLAGEFGGFFDKALANRTRPEGKWMVVGAMKPDWVARMKTAGVMPSTAEIAIRDRDIAHAFRDAKFHPLPAAWFRDLPRHLRNPQAVILDETHKEGAALLLVFDAPGNAKKLVVRVDYRTKKAGEMNLVETGGVVDVAGIRGQIGRGYTLIEGVL